LEILPVPGIGPVRPGDDLAALIAAAAPWLRDGDVLVVTSKIVSKAEGRLVEVAVDGPARTAARDAAITAETVRPVARRGATRIVQTRHGLVLASAGIDESNVDRGHLALLPTDPDASAATLRAALRERHGRHVAVIVTDTMGRPWRLGLTDVAIGAAGISPLRDHRGETDPYGNELRLTEIAVIDELAAAAELVKGKCDQVPVAVVRGAAGLLAVDGPGARALVRDAASDLFALGTAEARLLGLRDAARLADPMTFGDGPVPPAAVERALALVGAGFVHVTDDGVRDKLRSHAPAGASAVLVPVGTGDPMGDAGAGAAVARLRAALAADGLVSAWVAVDARTVADLVELPPGAVPLGILAVGPAPA
jgi:coenzyme F420-0:L-glutamate ligase/coenzyme F420-1:gamma-L-glutamate ligase